MKALILSASIGMGHVRAARALEKAMKEKFEEVRHEDVLDFANSAFRTLYRKAYVDLVEKAPELLGFAYEYSDREWKNLHYGMAFERLNIQNIIGIVRSYKPDVVISTHSLPADMISWLLCKKKIDCEHAIVITDFDFHPVWLCQHYSMYFVALEETKEHMAALGVEPERIIVSGIPIDPVFALKKDKAEMRQKHNLAPDRRTILISAGGLGMGPIEDLLCELMKLPGKNQIVNICGHNTELFAKTEAFASKISNAQGNEIKNIGFTDEIDEYMAASDLILGKPGGLTTSEALSKGLVFIIVSPVPGQEERNADHLLEEGVAIRCNNMPVLAYKIERLWNDASHLATMRTNVVNLARPSAAAEICTQVIKLIENNHSKYALPEHSCV